MPRTITQITLDDACCRLKSAVLNPYAVARYLAKPKQVEQMWKDLANKVGTAKKIGTTNKVEIIYAC